MALDPTLSSHLFPGAGEEAQDSGPHHRQQDRLAAERCQHAKGEGLDCQRSTAGRLGQDQNHGCLSDLLWPGWLLKTMAEIGYDG